MSIKMDHVTVYAPNSFSVKILKDICHTFEDGTITLLIGKTGSGKSTMLDILAGLSSLQEGIISVDGHVLWTGKRVNDAIRLKTGFVFQHPEHHLFARTVQGEFEYSLKPYHLAKEEIQARIQTTMQNMNLATDLLFQSPLVLSGGQKRRVSLGTTFATEPQWLLLDEPTSGLDPEAIQTLIGFIKDWKSRTNGGMVIATHDLDAFFPIADRVLVLQEGVRIANATPAELCEQPDILIQAGVGFPSSLDVSLSLKQLGFAVPSGWVSPTEMSEAILAGIKQFMPCGTIVNQQRIPAATYKQLQRPGENDTQQHQNSDTISPTYLRQIENLDPRTKWLIYIMLSVGVLLQQSWIGLFFAAIITVGLVVLTRVPIQELKKVIKPFGFFIFISMLLSGLTFGFAQGHFAGLRFSIFNALNTCKQLSRIVFIMILGMLLPLTTSHLKIKRGLEKSISLLPGMKLPAEAIALTVALMLRFIPMIMKEMNRFSRIVRARGKSRTKAGSIRLRDVHVVMIPLLLSVFQLAENLSLAMEVRGYKKVGLTRTSCTELQMGKHDVFAVLYSGIVLCLFFVLNYLSKLF